MSILSALTSIISVNTAKINSSVNGGLVSGSTGSNMVALNIDAQSSTNVQANTKVIDQTRVNATSSTAAKINL
ncbi:hypothetical protein CYY_000154 [Polysphondylium violaceum]|uniref:Uncharacterized protein n=1 Tax=Polysphondylium violaceum TaxID=133409 RepID=A0A8J4Q469_9MYCE|nr:hypothetical protein CYY_000154 [Polysphondylium violaceum]